MRRRLEKGKYEEYGGITGVECPVRGKLYQGGSDGERNRG
jgi:hypothetical protein